MPSQENEFAGFFNAVVAEVERCREKFPENKNVLHALTEEHGEYVQALLEGRFEDAEKELVQVAALVFRLATEGDREFPETQPTKWSPASKLILAISRTIENLSGEFELVFDIDDSAAIDAIPKKEFDQLLKVISGVSRVAIPNVRSRFNMLHAVLGKRLRSLYYNSTDETRLSRIDGRQIVVQPEDETLPPYASADIELSEKMAAVAKREETLNEAFDMIFDTGFSYYVDSETGHDCDMQNVLRTSLFWSTSQPPLEASFREPTSISREVPEALLARAKEVLRSKFVALHAQ